MSILLDTGPILALADRTDPYHRSVTRAWESTRESFVTSQAVIPEACYMLAKFLGTEAELRFLDSWRSADFLVEPVSDGDLRRVLEILNAYRDQRFGYTAAALFALAERKKVTRVMTLDRRHFDTYRPAHCSAWEHVL